MAMTSGKPCQLCLSSVLPAVNFTIYFFYNVLKNENLKKIFAAFGR